MGVAKGWVEGTMRSRPICEKDATAPSDGTTQELDLLVDLVQQRANSLEPPMPYDDDGLDAEIDLMTDDEIERDLIATLSPETVRSAMEAVSFADVRGYRHNEMLRGLQMSQLQTAYYQAEEPHSPQMDEALSVMFTAAAAQSFPTYLVERDLLEAIEQTDVPSDYSPEDLQLPFSSVLFVLPEDRAIDVPGYNKFTGFFVGRIPGGEYRWGKRTLASKLEFFSLRCIPAGIDPTKGEEGLGVMFPMEPIKLDEALGNLDTPPVLGGLNTETGEGDRHCLDLALKLILFMNALPEQVREPEFVKSHRIGAGPDRCVVWKPRFLGKKFKLISAAKPSHDTIGSGRSSPRMHWRRGHFKRVPTGQGRVERKRIWIQPTIVNPPRELSPPAHAN